jgi:hypothetical protein
MDHQYSKKLMRHKKTKKNEEKKKSMVHGPRKETKKYPYKIRSSKDQCCMHESIIPRSLSS